jgi:hypothetical protein
MVLQLCDRRSGCRSVPAGATFAADVGSYVGEPSVRVRNERLLCVMHATYPRWHIRRT